MSIAVRTLTEIRQLPRIVGLQSVLLDGQVAQEQWVGNQLRLDGQLPLSGGRNEELNQT